MKRLLPVIVLTLLIAVSGGAKVLSAADFGWMKKKDQAEESGTKLSGQHLLFRAGGYFPEIKYAGANARMNFGHGVEAGYGIQPLPWLAAEASFGFIETDDYDNDLYNMHFSVQMVPVTATVRAILPFKQFDLYALAGGGMYYTMLKTGNINQLNSPSSSDDKALLGYHYGGGASFLLGGGSSVGVEARRIETSWDDLEIGGTFLAAFVRMGF